MVVLQTRTQATDTRASLSDTFDLTAARTPARAVRQRTGPMRSHHSALLTVALLLSATRGDVTVLTLAGGGTRARGGRDARAARAEGLSTRATQSAERRGGAAARAHDCDTEESEDARGVGLDRVPAISSEMTRHHLALRNSSRTGPRASEVRRKRLRLPYWAAGRPRHRAARLPLRLATFQLGKPGPEGGGRRPP